MKKRYFLKNIAVLLLAAELVLGQSGAAVQGALIEEDDAAGVWFADEEADAVGEAWDEPVWDSDGDEDSVWFDETDGNFDFVWDDSDGNGMPDIPDDETVWGVDDGGDGETPGIADDDDSGGEASGTADGDDSGDESPDADGSDEGFGDGAGDADDELPDDILPAASPDSAASSAEDAAIVGDAESADGAAELLAGNLITYNLNELPTFAGRTLDDLISQYSKAVNAGKTYINGSESSYFDSKCSVTSPYKQGRLTADTLKAMQAMTDFYRWLTGSQALTRDSAQTVTLQKAALVRNFSYSRTVSGGKPSDMDASLWSAGASLTVDLLAHHSTPADSITSMMNCGYNRGGAYWYSMDNREILTNPALSMVRFGYSGDVAVGVAKAYKNSGAEAFTAFPAPGWNAAELVSTTMSAWNVRIGTDAVAIPDEAKLSVKVENLTTGSAYTCTKKNGKLKVNDCGICFVEPSVSGGSYAGMMFRVTISGLADSTVLAQTGTVSAGSDTALADVEDALASEESAVTDLQSTASSGEVQIVYTVQFASIFDQVSTSIRSYTFDYTKLMIDAAMSSDSNLRKIEAVLPASVIAVADTGAEFTLPIVGSWTLDKKNSCYIAKTDASALPAGIADRRGVLKTIRMPYEIADTNETRASFLTFSRNPAVVGAPMQIGVSRWDASYNRSRIYRIRANGDGTYSGKLWLDSRTSKSFISNTSSTYMHKFRVAKVKASYAGSYISIYYYNQFRDAAYVSSQILTLRMKEPSVAYSVYVRGNGWTAAKTNGAAAGDYDSLSGKNCSGSRIDAFRVEIKNYDDLGIRYTLARNGKNWSPTWRYNGDTAGWAEKGEKIEAIKMRLTGTDAAKYDLYYCVKVSGCGWLGWTKNGKPAGTRGRSKTIEAIRVKIVKKGAAAPAKCGRISTSFLYKS